MTIKKTFKEELLPSSHTFESPSKLKPGIISTFPGSHQHFSATSTHPCIPSNLIRLELVDVRVSRADALDNALQLASRPKCSRLLFSRVCVREELIRAIFRRRRSVVNVRGDRRRFVLYLRQEGSLKTAQEVHH